MNKFNFGEEVLVIGGGISGLSTAWFLHKVGIPFKLFEKEPETGGKISTVELHNSQLDFGPNSLRDRNGEIRQLAKELSILDDVIQISEAFKTRFIVRDAKLQRLSPSLGSLFATKIVSGKGKLRALAEPFISGKEDLDGDESVGEFLERRLGKEAVSYLADPVFSGIYAGDIYQMSKKTVLPELARYEQQYGSLVWGALRSKKEKKSVKPMVLSFRKGIQQLTDAITEKLSEHIIYDEVLSVQKLSSGYKITTEERAYEAQKVISCVPAFSLGRILEGFAPEVSALLTDIDYAPMLSTQVLFEKGQVDMQKNGFGFLVPRKENLRLLGAIWKSSIFPELSGENLHHFTLMTGGAHDRNVISDPVGEFEQEILAEFSNLMGIEEQPSMIKSRLWPKAIPQMNVGYEGIKETLSGFEQEYPGFYFGGNYRWGVSVPDCISGANGIIRSLA
ncbi:MAG TPA: protoporphyrinogen oxidase [Balneolaceae bacterium]|nr:protoporphyrinogen oxidase [Balneolaceae bacterium]